MSQKKYIPKKGRANAQKEDPKGSSARKKKEAVDLNPKAQNKQIHQALPLLFGLFAFLLFTILLCNLLCNAGNRLGDDPSKHWFGSFGYWVSYGLLAVFGQASMLLPLLLLNTALFWKRWVERRAQAMKIVFSVLFFLFVDAFLQVIYLTPSKVELSARELMELGTTSYAGGIIGGGLGGLMVKFLNLAGSYVIGIACILAFALLLWDFSPRRVLEKIKLRKELRSDRIPSVSEQEAEAAGLQIKLKKKNNALVRSGEEEPLESAVIPSEEVEIDENGKKLAPMPIPNLKAGEEAKKPEEALTDSLVPFSEPEPEAVDIDEPADGNRDEAAEAVFPRFVENKNGKKALRFTADPTEVFAESVEEPEEGPDDTHTPLPPEVPLEGGNVDTTPIRATLPESEKKPSDFADPAEAAQNPFQLFFQNS